MMSSPYQPATIKSYGKGKPIHADNIWRWREIMLKRKLRKRVRQFYKDMTTLLKEEL